MDIKPVVHGSSGLDSFDDFFRDNPWTWIAALVLLVIAAVIFFSLWKGREFAVTTPGITGERTIDHPERWPVAARSLLDLPDAEREVQLRRWRSWLRAWQVLRWPWLAASAAAAVPLFAMARLPSDDPEILRLELAGTSLRGRVLLFLTQDHDLDKALAFDVAFIAAYVILLAGLALWAGSFFAIAPFRKARVTVAWAVIGAGIADLVEDVLLYLCNHVGWLADRDWAWAIMAAMAWAKFAVILGAIAYIVAGAWSWWPLRKIREMLLADQTLDDPTAAAPSADSDAALGIAFSGGGIRASSMTLGALQVLERERSASEPRLGWDQAAKVTAISGGSNMSAGWSISRSHRDPTAAPEGAGSPNPAGGAGIAPWSSPGDDAAMTPQERHLLLNLGYLVANNPRGDQTDPAIGGKPGAAAATAKPYVPTAFATVVTGFLSNAVVLLLIMWVVARPIGWVMHWLSAPICSTHSVVYLLTKRPPNGLVVGVHTAPTSSQNVAGCVSGDPSVVWPAVIWVIIGIVGIVAWVVMGKLVGARSGGPQGAPSGLVQRVMLGWRAIGQGGLVIGLVLVYVLIALPYLMDWVGGATSGKVSIASVAAALGTVGSVYRILRKPAARYATWFGGIIFLTLVVLLSAYWANGATGNVPQWLGGTGAAASWIAAIVALVVVHVVVSPELWALAPFYRGKLRLAYANYVNPDAPGRVMPYLNDDATSDPDKKEPSLFAYVDSADGQPSPSTPLTICATATTTTRAIRTHYDIPAMSLTFGPEKTTVFVPVNDEGKWGRYECRTSSLNRLTLSTGRPIPLKKRLTTMMAVAISSAAVAPAMGKVRPGPTSMLLTFANIRLGVWLPNPRYVDWLEKHQQVDAVSYPMTRLGYLAKEFFGIHDFSDPYLYATDGGHWENTGIVELLRSGTITELLAIDADLSAGDMARSVSQAIDLAALECGVRVDLDLDPLRATLAHTNAPDYSSRSVNIGVFEYPLADGAPSDATRRAGVIWYSRPALTTDMPAELLAYRETHPEYPRISTSDQFFDTSTFVAYRGLGRYNATVIRNARKQLTDAFADAEAAATGQQFQAFVEAEEARPAAQRRWVCAEIIRVVSAKPSDDREAFYQSVRSALV